MNEPNDKILFDWRRLAFPAAVFLTGLLVSLPLLLVPGLLNTRGGGDSPFLLQRVHQLATAVAEGHFPVRWMPDANYGYGYPFYHYYAPLSIYITAAFRLFGVTIVRAIQLSQLLGFVVAASGIYLLAQSWLGSKWAGLLAAVAYTVAPFHMVNVYVRGDSLAEFWAMAFYPWVILAAQGMLRRQLPRPERAGRVALFALAYAALILSHNISALIFSPFLLLYIVLAVLFRQDGVALAETRPTVRPTAVERGRGLLVAGAGLLIALALAAWFFVPALAEQSLAQLGPVTEGYFHYSNHFRSGAELVQTRFVFDYSVDGGNAFRMGLVQAIAAVLGGLVLLFQRRRTLTAGVVFALLTFIGATFMITPWSRPLWDNLPLLPFAQFPWRFLSVQAFAAAVLTGALAWLPWRRVVSTAVIAVLLVAGMAGLRPDYLIVTDADVTPERLAQYEWFTGNIGTTVSAEYLPRTVQPRPYSSSWLLDGERDRVQVLAGELNTAMLAERRAAAQRWLINSDGATLLFPTMYWPGWTAAVDGEPAELRAAPGSGLIVLDVPAGRHTVTLQLTRTPVRLVSELFSLVTFVFVVLLWLWSLDWSLQRWGIMLLSLLVLVILAVAGHLALRPSLAIADLTWDFAQMAYLHHDVDDVRFENGVVLQRYDYSLGTAVPGETLDVLLHVAGADGSAVRVDLTTPTAVWPAIDPPAPVLASQVRPLDDEVVTFSFLLPPDLPPGLMLPRVTMLDGSRPLTPAGLTRGDLFLRPLKVNNWQPAENRVGLDVLGWEATVGDAGMLSVALAWFTERPLTHNYKLSLRLMAPDGTWLSQLDTQPGYGLRPSVAWRPGSWVFDRLALALPETLPDGPLALVVQLYDAQTTEAVLTRRLGEMRLVDGALRFVPQEPVRTLPEGIVPVTAVFDEWLGLRGYLLNSAAERVEITLAWEALAARNEDVTRFVHLVDAATGALVAQRDGFPQGDSFPTSQWREGELVTDVVTFDDVPPGTYRVVTGFYRLKDDEAVRLTAVGAEGGSLPDNAVVLPDRVTR